MNVPPGVFRGTNLMTPHFVEEGRVPGAADLYYRIETDHGAWSTVVEGTPSGPPLIGVTIRNRAGFDPTGLSTCFRSLTDAQDYIASLRQNKKEDEQT